jgi:NADH-quinone oxidoreductase subunit J
MVAEMTLVLVGSVRLARAGAPDAKPADTATPRAGRLIYTDYVFPFEIAAVILLVAIVAAIALTLRARKDSRYQKPATDRRAARGACCAGAMPSGTHRDA